MTIYFLVPVPPTPVTNSRKGTKKSRSGIEHSQGCSCAHLCLCRIVSTVRTKIANCSGFNNSDFLIYPLEDNNGVEPFTLHFSSEIIPIHKINKSKSVCAFNENSCCLSLVQVNLHSFTLSKNKNSNSYVFVYVKLKVTCSVLFVNIKRINIFWFFHRLFMTFRNSFLSSVEFYLLSKFFSC